jgi:hypothetical protein
LAGNLAGYLRAGDPVTEPGLREGAVTSGGGQMKVRRMSAAIALLALLLCVTLVGSAAAATQPFPRPRSLGRSGSTTVAVDGGAPRGGGDLFSILVTSTDTHEHGVTTPVLFGNLVVRTSPM